MLPKAHLTLHCRMSGSRWEISPSWLFGLWRFFFFYCSVYSCHLFLISSVSVMSIPFLSFIVTIFAWNFPLVSSIFLKRSLVFPILLFSFVSLHWSNCQHPLDHWKCKKKSRKTSISALLTLSKPVSVWITINYGKFWKRWEYQTTWSASSETCMQVRKQQLELGMEQQTGSK